MQRLLSCFAALALSSALLLAASGCDLTELNDNPNQPTEPTLPFLLTNAINADQEGRGGIADNYWGSFNLGYFGNTYAQYWMLTQYTSESRYALPSDRSGVVNNMWEDYYLAINDLQEIIRRNRQTPDLASTFGANDDQIAIATILQAWTYQVLTDTFGPVPFTEALRASENPSPAYTAQSEIYPALIDSLTRANELIGDPAGRTALADGDPIYGGDMESWKRFANSLKMRVAMRMSHRLPDEAAAAVQEALDTGYVFESNDQSAIAPFLDGAPYQNPLYVNSVVDGRDDWAMAEPLMGLMNDLEDPRRSAYAQEAPNGEYVGYPYGLAEGTAQAIYSGGSGSFSRPSDRVVNTATAPALLMLYDEVEFIRAEAIARGFMSGDANSAFESAITASMNYWDVDDQSAIDAYLEEVEDLDGSNYRQVLGEQRYIAHYMQGVQGWSVWRRLGFEGVLVPPVDGSIPDLAGGQQIAIRLTFPTDESTLNSENVEAAVSNLVGGSGVANDNQGYPLWWDVDL